MPTRQYAIADLVPVQLQEGLARLRTSLGVPGAFPEAVLADARQAARTPQLRHDDLTDVPFVTIDPPGATDLDQALHITRMPRGYIVRYAIADVAAFVHPDGPVDRESHKRGQTFYAPNHRTPLHPELLSENAASLLPGGNRPALVWELHLGKQGSLTGAHVRRAMVQSRAQLHYPGVQRSLANGTAPELVELLREVGQLRCQLEVARGGVSLPIAEQEVIAEGNHWRVDYRSPLPVEDWNAQLSLLTGMAAASMMLQGRVGILRTLAPAEENGLLRLRRTAKALNLSWPAAMSYPDFIRSLNPVGRREAAMLNAATMLFRGAGYAAFHGKAPGEHRHAALAAEYAHCTAPLRRLVDRYVGEICLALSAGTEVPEWVLAALDKLPAEMAGSTARVNKYERGIVNLVEALTLSSSIGDVFTGTVIELDDKRNVGTMQISDPAVAARVRGEGMRLGAEIRARCLTADVLTGTVEFRVEPNRATRSEAVKPVE